MKQFGVQLNERGRNLCTEKRVRVIQCGLQLCAYAPVCRHNADTAL